MNLGEAVDSIKALIDEIKIISGKNYVRIPCKDITHDMVEMMKDIGYKVELEEDVNIGYGLCNVYRITKEC